MSSPLAPAPQAPPESGAPPACAGNILIVDDEVFIRNAFQLYLETLGFKVRVAENGERALEIFSDSASRSSSPEVVILDLMMPGIHGIEVLKAIKARDLTVEVIILTGCGSMGTAIEALRHGAFDYITKPVVNFDEDLLKVVQEAQRSQKEKLRQPSRPPGGLRDGERERMQILDRIVEIAAVANRFRQNDEILEKMEELLKTPFGALGGVVLHRGLSNDFLPVYSWGFSGPFSPGDGRAAGESEVCAAVREGALGLFPIASLDAGWLGMVPEDLAPFSTLACLPLVLSGAHWGSLLLFFGGDLAPELRSPPAVHPFQALCPVLASLFTGALKQLRPL